jgi:hypothetical protein
MNPAESLVICEGYHELASLTAITPPAVRAGLGSRAGARTGE